MSGMSFRAYRKLLRLSSCLLEFEINVSSSCGWNKIKWFKHKCMSNSSSVTLGRCIHFIDTSSTLSSFYYKPSVQIYSMLWAKLNRVLPILSIESGWNTVRLAPRLLTNFLYLPDCLICLIRIDQAGMVHQICLSKLRCFPDLQDWSGWKRVPDLPELKFWSCSDKFGVSSSLNNPAQATKNCQQEEPRVIRLSTQDTLIFYRQSCGFSTVYTRVQIYSLLRAKQPGSR